VSAFKNQVNNFIDTIRGAAPPTITVEDGLASVEVIESAYRSMREQNWLNVEERPSAPKVAVAS
jgi:predicted dehydrogenase